MVRHYVRNPLTNKLVLKGGARYQQLVKNGIIHPSQQTQLVNNHVPILQDQSLVNWLNSHKLDMPLPKTLIPAGILLSALYGYQYGKQENGKLRFLVEESDLKQYLQSNRIKEMTVDTPLPFAIIMGPDVFKQYIKSK